MNKAKAPEKESTPPSDQPAKKIQLKSKLNQIKETAAFKSDPPANPPSSDKKNPPKNRPILTPKSSFLAPRAVKDKVERVSATKRPAVEVIDDSSDDDVFASPPKKKLKTKHAPSAASASVPFVPTKRSVS